MLTRCKKGRTGRSPEKRGIGPAHALNPILTIFGMWGGPLDVFLKFDFLVGRSPNFGATGGPKTAFFLFKSHRLLYNRTSCDKHIIYSQFCDKIRTFSLPWQQ